MYQGNDRPYLIPNATGNDVATYIPNAVGQEKPVLIDNKAIPIPNSDGMDKAIPIPSPTGKERAIPVYDLSPADRDIVIRTVIGEAANQPKEGQAAVAYSILNRLNSGGYGDTPTQVVLKPNQYEPWSTRSRELASIPRNSNIYNQVGNIVDDVFSGSIPDPTQGSTHFLQEDIVRQRRGGTLPNWAQGQGIKIGAHTFFKPDETKMASNQTPDYLGEFLGAKQAQQSASASADTTQPPQNDYLNEFISARKEQSGPTTPPEGYYGGKQHVTIQAPAPPFYAVDKSGKEVALKPGDVGYPVENKAYQQPSLTQKIGTDYLNRLSELGNQSGGMVSQGISDIGAGRPATGVGKVGLGLLGYPLSIPQAVDVPLARLTGNPEFAEKAAMLMPAGAASRTAMAARPAATALGDIIKDIGTENIPQIVKRLESNPNLTLMDVAPAVRGNAAGLATDPRNIPAMTHLNEFQTQRMAGRPADTVNIFEDALGPTPNMAATVQALKQKAADTGKQIIEPALESASAIPVKSLVRSIDRMIGSPEAIAGESPRIPLDPTQIRLLNLRKQITSGDAAPLNERVKFAIDPINDALKTGGMSEARSADFAEARRLLNSARRGNTSEEELLSGLKKLAKKQKIVGPIDDAVTMITKGPTEYRSAEFVHGVQSRLREEASNLSKSATGSDRNMAHDLFDAREKLVDAIDKASGGKYRAGLKHYAEDKEIDEGFREGFNVFSNPSSAEAMIANHPDMWEKWMGSASDAVKRAVSQGILFGANSRALNMRRGLDVPENSFAHQRISSVIGKQNADEIVRRLQDWRDIAETDNLLRKNSATAIRQAGQAARSVREPRSSKDIMASLMPGAVVGGAAHLASGGSPIMTALAGGGAIGAGKLANILGRAHDVASNRAYAQWASAMGSQKQNLVDILKQASAKSSPVSGGEKLMNLLPASVLQALPR